MKKAFTLLATLATASMLATGPAVASNWWESDPWSNPERGFNWYPPDPPPAPKPKKEEPKKEEPKKEAPKTAEKKEPPKRLEDLKTVEEIRKEVVRLRDIAIMEPSEKNIYTYLQANQYVMDKSSYFTDVWRRVVWQNPEIDYNARSPTANFAQVAMKERKNLESDALMDQLARTHGVVFFFRSDCDYCHLQAPVLQSLKQNFKIEVLPITLDGRPMREFPDARPDNGIASVVSRGRGIETVPALYLVSRDQKEIVPLGAGVLAMDEIVERIRVLYTTKPGDSF